MKRENFLQIGKTTTDVICLDIEKTRPGKNNNPPPYTVEVGMVRLHLTNDVLPERLAIKDYFTTLLKPPVKINNYNDHKITDTAVRNAPTIEQIAPVIVSFLRGKNGKTIIVSHNNSAEYLLFEELSKAGYGSSVRFIDTLQMARAFSSLCFDNKEYWKEVSIKNLTNYFCFKPLVPHRALDDAIACANLYRVFTKLFHGYGYRHWKGFEAINKHHKFVYEKEFTSNNNVSKRSVMKHKSRISNNELDILKQIHW